MTARLPPGQALTQKFPVVGEKVPAPQALDLESWRLRVAGLVAQPQELSYGELLALPQEELVADIHCVTGWTHLGMRLGGVRLAALLERAEPLAEARFVRFVAFSEREHDTSLPLELAIKDTWLIHSQGGSPLEVEHGWPLRSVVPSRYFYKSLKWLGRIELLAEDRLGFWERESSYHNVGDPWPGDQRFTSGSLRPEQVERFRAAKDYASYRGKVVLSADLRGWEPATKVLGALALKNCDLCGAKLAGCDLRGVNLSLSDLRGADLAGADLRGGDLEGANFSGADLRGADLSGTALSATRFFEEGGGEARVAGMRWVEVSGLLEGQEAFLKVKAG